MIDPMILFNIDAPVEIYGAEGGSGSLLWKRLAGGVDLCGDWESFEYARLQPGGSIGEHVHHRTEEIYFVTGGRAVMHMDDTASEIGPGDLIMTPIDGRHSAETIDGEGLEFIVAEVLPPDILFPDRPRPPGCTGCLPARLRSSTSRTVSRSIRARTSTVPGNRSSVGLCSPARTSSCRPTTSSTPST